MRDAGRKLADRLHFLHLAKARLRLFTRLDLGEQRRVLGAQSVLRCGRPAADPRIPLALAPAAFEAGDAVSRTIQPVRAPWAAMAVRAQPARANENLLGPVTAGAFLRTHQFLP